MKKLLIFLSLFSSVGVLFCCALPVLLVSLGLGGVFVSLTSAVPQIHFIGEYKLFIFTVTAVLLSGGFFLTRPSRVVECPIDEDQRNVCQTVKPWSRIILYISTGFYLLGFLFAYVLPVFFV